MTVETKLPYDQDYIEQFSKEKNEPEWMRVLRLQALEQADALEMPKPDKTNRTRWNFSRFKHVSEHETTDRKSTRLNFSHVDISYAVFCLKKKNKIQNLMSEKL